MVSTPKVGLNFVAEYQVSGLPFISKGSAATAPAEIAFNYIAKSITLINNDSTNGLKIGFTLAGTNGTNYIQLDAGKSITFDIRCKKIFLASTAGTCSYSLLASLTGIEQQQMGELTGSTGSGSFGWPGVG